MKTIYIFFALLCTPSAIFGQTYPTDTLLSQVRLRKSAISQQKLELDSVIAQSNLRASETLYGELGGAGGWLSINYEQRFGNILNKNLSWRVGIGLSTWNHYSQTFSADNLSYRVFNFFGIATVPLMINYFTDGDGSPYHFEIGAGIVPWFGTEYIIDYTQRAIAYAPPTIEYIQTAIQSKPSFRFFGPVSIGYRYQPVDGGFFFKISAMGLVGGGYSNLPILPWIGFSFGETYSIK